MRRSDLSSETPKYLQVAHGENPGPPKTGPNCVLYGRHSDFGALASLSGS